MVILAMMGVFYFLNWVTPAEKLHRRPALILLSRYYSIVFLLMLSATVILFVKSDTSGCAVNSLLSLGELLIPLLIYRTIYHDSLFWQGLFVRGTANLNEPLLGMWDMGRETMDLVAHSISELEQEIVPIIPFGKLFVDTSRFFSGGAARVYIGRFGEEEVAIKFLFCIELTPERVVAFCHEATILNSLQHPNIVKCHGVSVMPPALCLITEFCNFGSLFDFLHSVGKEFDGVTASDGTRSQTSSRNSSHPSLSNALRYGPPNGDSIKEHILRDSSSVRSSDAESSLSRPTDISLSRNSNVATLIKPPSSSNVSAVPERFSLTGSSPSSSIRKVLGNKSNLHDISILDTVTEKSTSEYSMDASMTSTNQFYNQNIVANLPNTINEIDSYGIYSSGKYSSAAGSSGEGNVSSGVVGSGSSTRKKKLMSAVTIMRNSFLGLGLGPSGVPKTGGARNSTSVRQR